MWPGPKNGCYELKVVRLTASKRTETSVLQPQGMDEEPEGAWKQIDPSQSSLQMRTQPHLTPGFQPASPSRGPS